MKLKIISGIDRPDLAFDVIVNNQKKRINNVDNEANYELDRGEVSIVIKQEIPYRLNKFLSLIIYILTMVFRGIFYIIMFASETDWYADIMPFRISVKCNIILKEDTVLNLKYIPAEFNKKESTWTYPQLILEDADEMNIEYEPYLENFKYQFVCFCKRVLSISFVAAAFFAFLFYKSFGWGVAIASVVISVILAAILIFIPFILIYNYRKLLSLQAAFKNQYS